MNELTGNAASYSTTANRAAEKSSYSYYVKKMQKASKKSRTKTKKLNYNHREIAALLLRAGRAQSASAVLTLAKGRLGNLKRCAASGQYNRREVDNAIAHARRMVQCAQLKVRNLKEEETDRRREQKESSTEKQQRKSEIKSKVRQKERRLEKKLTDEHLRKLQEQKREYQEMERKRRMHRNEEHGKIMEANMKYIKGQADSTGDSSNAVCIESPAVILEINEGIVYMDERQIEQQVKQEMAGSVDTAADSAGAGMAGAVPADAGSAADVGGSVDMAAGSVNVVV